jgi:Bacterial dnaA protein helix-turn-helix
MAAAIDFRTIEHDSCRNGHSPNWWRRDCRGYRYCARCKAARDRRYWQKAKTEPRLWRDTARFNADVDRAMRIIEVVAAKREVSLFAILGEDRKYPVTRARALAIWLVREMVGLGWHRIARIFDQPYHSTIIRAYLTIQQRMEKQPIFRAMVYRVGRQAGGVKMPFVAPLAPLPAVFGTRG